MGGSASTIVCGDQRTAPCDQFSPAIFMWLLGLNSGHQACAASTVPAELSHWPQDHI